MHGTVNDLAVGGAVPLYLSAAFILEEGLALEDLSRIVDSMREACATAGVALVTFLTIYTFRMYEGMEDPTRHPAIVENLSDADMFLQAHGPVALRRGFAGKIPLQANKG